MPSSTGRPLGEARDRLRTMRRTGLDDLAVPFSCFNANVCKKCTMLIDGNVEYACIAKLRKGLIQLDRSPMFP
jgi:hypothetical protein